MEFTFRLARTGDPDGQIGLARLVAFGQRFQIATLRSAQAESSVPAFRRSMANRPQYRLVGLADGSVALRIATVDDRELSQLAVTRHLTAIDSYRRSGAWPSEVTQGELEAWAQLYLDVLVGSPDEAYIEVSVDDEPYRIDRADVAALREGRPSQEERSITCVGQLHMIDVSGSHPRFRIDTDDIDLVFDLSANQISMIDPVRWQRVRAEAIWFVGTNRARLVGNLEPTDEPMGIVDEVVVSLAGWAESQIDRIANLGRLHSGWNDGKGQAISAAAAEAAQELTRRIHLRFHELIPDRSSPYFFPTNEGTIEFEWQVDDRFLLVEITGSSYAVLATDGHGDGERILLEGAVGQATLYDWIRWLLTGEMPTGDHATSR